MKLREPVNGLTHLIGALLSVAGLLALVLPAFAQKKILHVAAFSVYGASLIGLYSASALYHLLPASRDLLRRLRQLDHVMIYLLIAGTYTPMCLIPLRGEWGRGLLAVVWGLALAGVMFTLYWLHAPRWLSTMLYILMGWTAVAATSQVIHTVPAGGLLWLLAGGVFYTGGAIVYAMKRPNPIPGWLGFHEIWHLFVMAGSFCHFMLMWRHVSAMG